MVKLIACDIDGTLLKSGEKKISPQVFEQIERLHNKGIVFCLASGRQYNSLLTLAGEYADRIYYLCNNGAIIYRPCSGGPVSEDVLSTTPIPRAAAEDICSYILAREGVDLNVGCANTDYVCPQFTDIDEHLTGLGYNVKKISDVSQINEDMLKITACCPDGSVNYMSEFDTKWGGSLNVSVSGHRWLDITVSNKGTGIKALCEALNISAVDVMAIGDNYNDLPMLDIVGHPVIMESAPEEIKRRYSKVCFRVQDVLAEI